MHYEQKEALMNYKTIEMQARKRIALVAHDHKKRDLVEWARYNRAILVEHELCATGTTGSLLQETLDLQVTRLQSGRWEVISRSEPGLPTVKLTW